MAKKELDQVTDDVIDFDILDDIQPEDYVFVISPDGALRGMSLPETLEDEDEITPVVEEIIQFLVEKTVLATPSNKSVH